MRIGITEAAETIKPGVRAGFDKGLASEEEQNWMQFCED